MSFLGAAGRIHAPRFGIPPHFEFALFGIFTQGQQFALRLGRTAVGLLTALLGFPTCSSFPIAGFAFVLGPLFALAGLFFQLLGGFAQGGQFLLRFGDALGRLRVLLFGFATRRLLAQSLRLQASGHRALFFGFTTRIEFALAGLRFTAQSVIVLARPGRQGRHLLLGFDRTARGLLVLDFGFATGHLLLVRALLEMGDQLAFFFGLSTRFVLALTGFHLETGDEFALVFDLAPLGLTIGVFLRALILLATGFDIDF